MNRPIVIINLLLVLLLLSGCVGSDVRINEIMASNGETIVDEDGDYEDWIELYNTGARSVNLRGYYLSDDEEDPLKWKFPEVIIEPGEFLLVWASAKNRTEGPLHTNFRISRDGEPIILSRPNGKVADSVPPVTIPQDVSLGPIPDGGEEWFYLLTPTPGEGNEKSQGNTVALEFPLESRGFPFALLAFSVLLVIFIPLIVVFYRRTRR